MAAKVKHERGAYWLVVHAKGKRVKRRFGTTLADKRRAEKAAEEIDHRIALGQYEVNTEAEPKPEPVPFDHFAESWVRNQVILPTEREIGDHLAPGTARSYASHIRFHLVPYFGGQDLRSMSAESVQSFYDRCVETGCPRSQRTIAMVIMTLGMVLAHARATGINPTNPVQEWKQSRKKSGRRRSRATNTVTREMVLSGDELELLLTAAEREAPTHHALFLLLSDTGARFGEATALRWSDIDLEAGTARIERSFSSGQYLGLTKTGGRRTVELSSRLRAALASKRPDLFPEDALAFPNAAGHFIDPASFRVRVFNLVVRKAFGRNHRRVTPHTLRHTFASLHLARGSNLLWVQNMGGWQSPQVMLDTYTHFLPTELSGFADALAAAPDGTIRHQPKNSERSAKTRQRETRGTSRRSKGSAAGLEPRTRGLLGRESPAGEVAILARYAPARNGDHELPGSLSRHASHGPDQTGV